MKNLICAIALCSVSLLLTATNCRAATISFSLETTTNNIHVGDVFDIDVVAHDLFTGDNTDELLAFGLNATSSIAGLLEFQGSSINPLFSDDSLLVNLHAAGSAFPGIASDPSTAQSFNLATLHFKALAAGQVSLAIAADLSDFNQGLIFLNQGPMGINASRGFDITAVPVPATLWLFVSGVVVSFGGMRRKRG
ncbi:PEP-CTERM sorting domain-containing protein [Methylomonas albis]|uniref:PEP-CTERM sorting domain-containing protein n=1 Tax=Methylomonas albis TaxID=1854563 RepID=A0ABR9D3S8_9GAMM|nr:PEP-CTERM sorting domain-containing protein [Methylomonas albis]MBD9357446.1 PEP-CTERM sorting domain-containing protein [Methylomonas albis]